jgi:hypothetical protein
VERVEWCGGGRVGQWAIPDREEEMEEERKDGGVEEGKRYEDWPRISVKLRPMRDRGLT